MEKVLDSITDGFVTLDKEWRYTFVNKKITQIAGMQKEDFLGRSIWELFPDTVGSSFDTELHRAIAEQITVHFEYFYSKWNRWFENRVYPSDKGVSIFTIDITENKRVQKRLAVHYAIGCVLAEGTKLADAVPAILQSLCESLEWEVGIFWSVDPQADVLRCVDIWHTSDINSKTFNQCKTFSFGEGLPGRVWASGQPAWIENINENDNFLRTDEAVKSGLKTAIELPIISGNKILGVIECFSNRIQEFDAELLQIIAAIGGQIGQFMNRKRTEEALQKSQELFDSFMSNSPATAFIKDQEGRYVYVNRLVEQTFNRNLEDWVGKTDFDLFPIETAQQLRKNDLMVLEQGQTIKQLETAPHEDGEHHYISFKFPIGNAVGKQLVAGMSVDITERKQAEEALRESELNFRTLADTMPQLFWTTRPDGYHEYFNQRWYEYTGMTLEQTQGWGWSHLLHPEDKQRCLDVWNESLRTGEKYNIEYRFRRSSDGQYRWFLGQAFPLRDADGRIIRWFGSCTDIHDQKCVVFERDQALERERAARAAAESANRIKDEFLAVLSHELRSPLNPILGWAKLLQKGKVTQQNLRRGLETIARNAELQARLIEDLLDVSRILRGKLTLSVCPVNLEFIISEALETVRLAAQAKKIQLTTVLEPDVGQVVGDAARLQQVVWNLLSNAIKFTPQGGTVEVRLERVGTIAQLQVIDTGIGISPEFLPNIFDDFRQENSSTTRKFGGLGLGLAIVHHLVELHGGTVQAESLGENHGATFTVRLPLASNRADTLINSKPQDEFFNLNGIKVLVVDDDADSRDFIAFALEQSGALVTAVSSASEALEVMTRVMPDILVSDIGMPEMDGYEMLRQIRGWTKEQGGQIPAIALTAYAGECDRKQALAAGFQVHISKPIEIYTLTAATIGLLRGSYM
ncbi:hypothetical protein NUACC21_69210 [Scytonema sp. NUACC21]